MNKKDLADALSNDIDISKEKAAQAVDMLFASIENSLKKGEEVRIPGFGTFKTSKRKAREGRNPATNQTIHIPATVVPRFTAAKGLKDAVAK
jgi:DNA-binding protein HU-beta